MCARMRSPRSPLGFTLVELLVVMAVLGVVAAVAAPSFRDFVIRRNISAQVSELGASLRLARSEAVKQGREVSLCPVADMGVTELKCNMSVKDWGKGYMVIVGAVGTTQHPYLRIQQPQASGGKVEVDRAGSVVFLPNGLRRPDSPVQFIFRPPLPDNDGSYASLSRKVCLGVNGLLSDRGC